MQVQPLLKAMGRGILDIGDEARQGSVMKLVGNFFISSMIELISEGMSLGEKNGVARESTVEYLSQMFPGVVTTGAATLIRTSNCF